MNPFAALKVMGFLLGNAGNESLHDFIEHYARLSTLQTMASKEAKGALFADS